MATPRSVGTGIVTAMHRHGVTRPIVTAASVAPVVVQGQGIVLLENGFNLLLENGQAVLEG